jgi:Periplasmic binding protein
MLRLRSVAALRFLFVLFLSSFAAPARAADPIKVGFSMALTGWVAQNGKQLIIALEMWRDDVNANGGLLGRPVELVYYDEAPRTLFTQFQNVATGNVDQFRDGSVQPILALQERRPDLSLSRGEEVSPSRGEGKCGTARCDALPRC